MLVDRHWRVKVTDFNLSRMVKSGSSNASVTSMLANNPRWLAPEVINTATIATMIMLTLIIPIICSRFVKPRWLAPEVVSKLQQ